MSLTKNEEATIRNVIDRLNRTNCGCSPTTFGGEENAVNAAIALLNRHKIQCVSRIYLDTWVVPALELILPGKDRDTALARSLSR